METLPLPLHDILSVTKLNESVRDVLETRFAMVRVRGEISDLHEPASGHIYFALIDPQSRIRAVIWRGNRRRITIAPQSGQKVIVTGRIAVYPPRGEYQLIVEGMQVDGQGDARARLLALHAKLTQEGLFAPERKRPLPPFPKIIGVVTSATGAALQDIIRVLDDRGLGYHLIVAAARVQGEFAAKEIVDALQNLSRDGRSQVIICGRGGGSADDLAVFNDEAVVRAIAASPIPIISAVGHEVDLTLTDLAADLRAPTPSAAAQMVMPEKKHLEQRLHMVTQGLHQGFAQYLLRQNDRLTRIASRLLHPRQQIENYRFRCDELQERLLATSRSSVQRLRPVVVNLHNRLALWPQTRALPTSQTQLNQNQKRLSQEVHNLFQQKTIALNALVARLHGVSPLEVLNRGYAIVYDGQGQIQTTMQSISPGDPISIRLSDGTLDATVTQTRE
ncbi:MAG: exodeoxyribonuclease VII large subunit [Magnetococcales bacterium]|nr:exodeoxyribonuclease VII large subunit [Magnetococcales bacterium]